MQFALHGGLIKYNPFTWIVRSIIHEFSTAEEVFNLWLEPQVKHKHCVKWDDESVFPQLLYKSLQILKFEDNHVIWLQIRILNPNIYSKSTDRNQNHFSLRTNDNLMSHFIKRFTPPSTQNFKNVGINYISAQNWVFDPNILASRVEWVVKLSMQRLTKKENCVSHS